jgi:hypothetical protein
MFLGGCMGKEYSASLVSRPFLYIEFKKLAELRFKGFSQLEINDKIFKENIFQINAQYRRREVFNTLQKRLNELDNYLVNKLMNANFELGKILCIYSVMKTDQLFFEFMIEVYREKCILGINEINNKDFELFFIVKKEQSEKVNSWKEYTILKLKQVYKKFLVDSGLGIKIDSGIEINKPVVDNDTLNYIKTIGDATYINAILGV